ncbi:MAG: hypothetical protein O6765_04985, partial [Gammaproteobacteria bacterium]|nr:hypothetical protein [Gammaproteobacteria bacterium]
MVNRRLFLTAAGQAAAGIFVLSRSFDALAQSRKEVYVGGRRMTVIDIHAHCLFQDVAPIIQGTAMANANLSDFVTLSPRRLEEMNARGIDIAALSVNGFWWYAADQVR